MKIILVHGDNTKKIDNRVAKFVDSAKNRGWEIARLDKKDDMDLIESLSSISLFDITRLFIVDGIKYINKKEIEWLNKNKDLDVTIVVKNYGIVGKRNIDKLPITATEKYETNINVFKFTDTFKPGNAKLSIKSLHELLEKEPIELVLAMLARHIRDLYAADKNYSDLMQSWKYSKLKPAADKFGSHKIKVMIEELAQIDYKSKTGQTDPVRALDLYIVKYLE